MGIDTGHRGLAARLLRSASLLGAIALLRFAFVLGVLHVRPRLLVLANPPLLPREVSTRAAPCLTPASAPHISLCAVGRVWASPHCIVSGAD